MTLLVATQNPNATAETYVRQHMRRIAPGRTVGLSFALEGAAPSDLPFLAVRGPANPVLRKLALLAGRQRYGFAGAPVGRSRRQVIRFLRENGVSVVLAEFGPTGAALRDICGVLNIPLVVNFHGYDATVMPQRPEIRRAYALLARDAAGFICGSEHFRGTLTDIGLPTDRIEVIPCGIHSDDFGAAAERDGHTVIAVGRLTAKKAPDLAIRAFALARRQVPGLRLEMIGDGPKRGACEAMITELGLADSVTLRGALDHSQVKSSLSRADIFIQHSIVAPNGDTESQGISLLEAMASALPVVATDHNGFSETVADGETGYLVPERDVEAMAARIVALAQDADLRARMGAAGQQRARRDFDEEPITARLRACLSRHAAF